MSKSRWSKRWLYDPTVEVPRTTRWRRNIEFSDPTSDEEIDDIRGEFSSEVYEDLGKNTSPFKKRKLVDECLETKIMMVNHLIMMIRKLQLVANCSTAPRKIVNFAE